jgi:hypothetical protein
VSSTAAVAVTLCQQQQQQHHHYSQLQHHISRSPCPPLPLAHKVLNQRPTEGDGVTTAHG